MKYTHNYQTIEITNIHLDSYLITYTIPKKKTVWRENSKRVMTRFLKYFKESNTYEYDMDWYFLKFKMKKSDFKKFIIERHGELFFNNIFNF